MSGIKARLGAAASASALWLGLSSGQAAAQTPCNTSFLVTQDSEIQAALTAEGAPVVQLMFRQTVGDRSIIFGFRDQLNRIDGVLETFDPTPVGSPSFYMDLQGAWPGTPNPPQIVAGGQTVTVNMLGLGTAEVPATPEELAANAILAGEPFEAQKADGYGGPLTTATFQLDRAALEAAVPKMQEAVNFLIEQRRLGNCSLPAPAFDYGDEECFLTTATVHAVGLADDCWELRTLRRFRDAVLMHTGEGRALVERYYEIAPGIVRAVGQRADARATWLKTYVADILPCAVLARLGLNRWALAKYSRMTTRLERLAA